MEENALKILFLAWQDPDSRCWLPIGQLTFDGDNYRFVYTQGAQEAEKKCDFQPLQSFPDLNMVYFSEKLFPLFSNRVLPRSRPEYQKYVEWLNVPKEKDDPIALLARSGGRRETDSLEIFPLPQPDEYGQYHIHFFSHGLRYLPNASTRVESLSLGESLSLMPEPDNPVDPDALMLKTQDDIGVGYCPRYLLEDLHVVLKECCDWPIVNVEQINLSPVPLQYRLLCNMTACWPDDFQPFSSSKYQPIVKNISP